MTSTWASATTQVVALAIGLALVAGCDTMPKPPPKPADPVTWPDSLSHGSETRLNGRATDSCLTIQVRFVIKGFRGRPLEVLLYGVGDPRPGEYFNDSPTEYFITKTGVVPDADEALVECTLYVPTHLADVEPTLWYFLKAPYRKEFKYAVYVAMPGPTGGYVSRSGRFSRPSKNKTYSTGRLTLIEDEVPLKPGGIGLRLHYSIIVTEHEGARIPIIAEVVEWDHKARKWIPRTHADGSPMVVRRILASNHPIAAWPDLELEIPQDWIRASKEPDDVAIRVSLEFGSKREYLDNGLVRAAGESTFLLHESLQAATLAEVDNRIRNLEADLKLLKEAK